MKKKSPMIAVSICMLIFTLAMTTIYVASPTPKAITVSPTQKATVSISPTTITGPPPDVGDNFTIYINIASVTDLYQYAIGWSWNPAVLECLSWTYNTTFFPPDIKMPGVIDNVVGRTIDRAGAETPFGATLTGLSGVTGSGTLADLEFKVIRGGTSWINFTLCELLDSYGSDIPRNLVNGTFLLSTPSGPRAVKTHMPTSPVANQTVRFDASYSLSGFNGTHDVAIANYTWDFGDGTPVVAEADPVITHNYTAAGTYTVNLTVMCVDDPVLIGLGLTSDSTWQNITIRSPFPNSTVSISPASIVGPPPSLGDNFTVYINIENVTDLYFYAIGLSWNPAVLECLSWTYNTSFFLPDITMAGVIDNAAGKIDPYSAALTDPPHATGVTGDGTLADVKFRVKSGGVSWINFTKCVLEDPYSYDIPRVLVNAYFEYTPITPVADFTYSPLEPVRKESMTFDASASTPDGGRFVSYEWDFGDGTPKVKKTGNFTHPPDPIVYHSYTTAATYTVTLNVTDSERLWNTTSKSITISPIRDIAVKSVTLNTTEVTAGESVEITVIVRNKGDLNETFDVTVYYNTTEIASQTVTDLPAGAKPERSLTFTWDTTGLDAGSYTIKAVATSVTGETVTDDNTFIDGTVIVKGAPKPGIPWIWIIIPVVAIAIVVPVVYMVMRRRASK